MVASVAEKLLNRHLDGAKSDWLVNLRCEDEMGNDQADAAALHLFKGGMNAMADRVRSWINDELGKIERDPGPVQFNETRAKALRQVLTLLEID